MSRKNQKRPKGQKRAKKNLRRRQKISRKRGTTRRLAELREARRVALDQTSIESEPDPDTWTDPTKRGAYVNAWKVVSIEIPQAVSVLTPGLDEQGAPAMRLISWFCAARAKQTRVWTGDFEDREVEGSTCRTVQLEDKVIRIDMRFPDLFEGDARASIDARLSTPHSSFGRATGYNGVEAEEQIAVFCEAWNATWRQTIDPKCVSDGCYMFAADTPERASCVEDCRLCKPQPKVTKAGLAMATLVGTLTGAGLSSPLSRDMDDCGIPQEFLDLMGDDIQPYRCEKCSMWQVPGVDEHFCPVDEMEAAHG